MVQARFINDTTSIEVTSEQEETVVNVSSKDVVGNVGVYSSGNHNNLTGRDLPDQHPIEAITNLRDILNRLWTFTYEQGEPSTIWIVQHNLGRNPNWVVVDSAGSVQLPDKVTYNNDNQITFEFIGAFAGKVFLN